MSKVSYIDTIMNYKSVADLNRDILAWIPDLPRDISLIVGIPRSGMLVASLLALHLDLPLTDIDGLINKQVFASGHRSLKNLDTEKLFEDGSKVFVVDDSFASGRQMGEVRERILKANVSCEVVYGAVYVKPGSERLLDLWCKRLTLPRIFQWHLFHRGTIPTTCIDIDGVLCRDPSPDENDDGVNYIRFIHDVKPNIIPSKKVGWLVTSRLEKYRPQTEEWLQRHGIQYDHLVMMDYETKAERQIHGDHALYKARVYAATPAVLFIESSAKQAAFIAKKSGKPVLCYEGDGELFLPGKIKGMRRQAELQMRSYTSQFFKSPSQFMVKVHRKILKIFGFRQG